MPIVCHNDLFAVSSSSKGKQVFNIKSKTFWTFLPDFALVLKNSFSLKLPVGLPFISFCSKANILLAEDAISWELLVIRLFWCLLPSQDSLVRMRSAVVDSAPLARKEIYPVRCHRSWDTGKMSFNCMTRFNEVTTAIDRRTDCYYLVFPFKGSRILGWKSTESRGLYGETTSQYYGTLPFLR